ncbi:MAG: DUF4105 domain-containing protein [Muribaculaceae bacterium]|nr:DUF4105 domain-containing protein [Muribaculaceae bacterium]
MTRIVRLLCLIFLSIISAAASAAVRPDTAVYFVNVYAGPAIYELDGHSAILVDIKGREPMAYNYGVFDFNAPNFIYRFVKGETDYMAVAVPWHWFMREYRERHRRVVAHELNFDSAQKARLLELLKENVKPENATYRYNYVKDNCATRPLRAVELAAGDSLVLSRQDRAVTPTFRSIMRKAHADYPWYQFGIDLALGTGIDYPLTDRETSFSPIELDAMLPAATVAGRPLTVRSEVLTPFGTDDAKSGPTPWYLTPLFVGWVLFAMALLLTVRDLRRGKPCRIFDALWFGIQGLVGCVLSFLIFISVHEATSPNWLYLWLNPLCLIVPACVWTAKFRRILTVYHIADIILIVALAVIWAVGVQSPNAAFIPLILVPLLRSGAALVIDR